MNPSSYGSIGGGAIAGIVIGSLVFIGLIVLGIFFYKKRLGRSNGF